MNIVVMTGSPNKNGVTMYLADKFIGGAEKAGNTVKRFDTAFMDIEFCRGCNYCRDHETQCVFDDDFAALRQAVEECDLLVWVSPVYYFTVSAQLKRAIDRFHAFGRGLRNRPEKTMLIAACADARPQAADTIKDYFRKFTDYIHWENIGELVALGAGDMAALLSTDYPAKAAEAGGALK